MSSQGPLTCRECKQKVAPDPRGHCPNCGAFLTAFPAAHKRPSQPVPEGEEDVERFIYTSHEMMSSPGGKWVLYSDYEQMQEERDDWYQAARQRESRVLEAEKALQRVEEENDELHADIVGEKEIRLEARHAVETVERRGADRSKQRFQPSRPPPRPLQGERDA